MKELKNQRNKETNQETNKTKQTNKQTNKQIHNEYPTAESTHTHTPQAKYHTPNATYTHTRANTRNMRKHLLFQAAPQVPEIYFQQQPPPFKRQPPSRRRPFPALRSGSLRAARGSCCCAEAPWLGRSRPPGATPEGSSELRRFSWGRVCEGWFENLLARVKQGRWLNEPRDSLKGNHKGWFISYKGNSLSLLRASKKNGHQRGKPKFTWCH